MPDPTISNAEYSVSRYGLTARATIRVMNHNSSGMSGEPSCSGVSPTWWCPLTKAGIRTSLPATQHGRIPVAALQIVERADRDDHAVLLQHGAVRDDGRWWCAWPW